MVFMTRFRRIVLFSCVASLGRPTVLLKFSIIQNQRLSSLPGQECFRMLRAVLRFVCALMGKLPGVCSSSEGFESDFVEFGPELWLPLGLSSIE